MPTLPPESDRPLHFGAVLIALALLTAVATLTKLIGLSAPMPDGVAPTSLTVAGYRTIGLAVEPPQQGRELSRGTLRRFRLVPRQGVPHQAAPGLTVSLVPVRSRTATGFSAETLAGQGLSLATVRDAVPSFSLNDARIATLPGAQLSHQAIAGDEVVFGRGRADPAGSITTLQTCLTRLGAAAARADTLAWLASTGKHSDPPSGPWPRLRRLAGLSPARHECLAVQLELGPTSSQARLEERATQARRQLEAGWRVVRAGLRP